MFYPKEWGMGFLRRFGLKTGVDFTYYTWSTFRNLEIVCNKKAPEGVYPGRVGVRKNYGYVGWQWKVE